MRNKFLTEALGWGFIITFLFIVATCSYDLGKKKGRKEVFLDEVLDTANPITSTSNKKNTIITESINDNSTTI